MMTKKESRQTATTHACTVKGFVRQERKRENIRVTSSERIASMSVTKDKGVSVHSGAQQPQSETETEHAGRAAATGIWKR